jgi:hypothetical protein
MGSDYDSNISDSSYDNVYIEAVLHTPVQAQRALCGRVHGSTITWPKIDQHRGRRLHMMGMQLQAILVEGSSTDTHRPS